MAPEPGQTLVDVGAWRASAWFLQNSLDAFVGLREGELQWVGGAWSVSTGWTSEQSVHRLYNDFLHPNDVAPALADLAALPPAARAVFTYRVAGRSRGWIWMRHHAVRAADGWVLMILRDVTVERQRDIDNEEARRIAAMVRQIAGVTAWRYDVEADEYVIDPDFTDHAGRAPLERRSGVLTRSEIHPEDGEAVDRIWRRSLATGEPGTLQYRTRRHDGEPWTHLRAAWQGVRRRASGRWDVLGIAEDVTEMAEARDAALQGEKAARAAAEAKSQFLANISHEIRTPMNGVLGVLHLIGAEPPAEERQRLVARALAAGVGLSDLLNDIIDFSDVEAGRLELAREPVDPAEQLEAIVAMFAPEAQAKGVALTQACQAEIGWVAADPARLRKIFFHFIGNAVKFTHRGAIEARLSASGAGEAMRLRLEVEDTGVGVAEAARPGLFERFSQADASATRRYGGPGLGLAITRRLAELMGGSVGFESRAGEGSTFWAEVCAPAAAEPAATSQDRTGDWLSGVKVLVVEDNPTNRLVATRMLGQLGAAVSTAENGAAGVAAVESADFDLVFMDIQMPVMDGVEAARRIRALGGDKAQVPILATTANVMPEQLAAYRACGIDGVVAKPISPAALVAEVARVAGAAGGSGAPPYPAGLAK